MANFIRVVHRQGWDVERVGEESKRNFPSRDEAMAFATGEAPDWIEVGEVVYETPEVPQHHRWSTLRRRPDGTYQETGLKWGGKPAPR